MLDGFETRWRPGLDDRRPGGALVAAGAHAAPSRSDSADRPAGALSRGDWNRTGSRPAAADAARRFARAVHGVDAGHVAPRHGIAPADRTRTSNRATVIRSAHRTASGSGDGRRPTS